MTDDVIAISGIAAGGDGVGRMSDGRAVFVPRTAPGDRVELRAGSLRRHRRYARGEAARIVDPGADRVPAACPHYEGDRCGGCQLQHLSYDAQLRAKRSIVGEALRRLGKVDLADPEIVAATERWRYRTKLSLAVKRVAGAPAQIVAGFHPYDDPARVFPLDDCRIADVRLMALWQELKGHLDLLPLHASRLTLRHWHASEAE